MKLQPTGGDEKIETDAVNGQALANTKNVMTDLQQETHEHTHTCQMPMGKQNWIESRTMGLEFRTFMTESVKFKISIHLFSSTLQRKDSRRRFLIQVEK